MNTALAADSPPVECGLRSLGVEADRRCYGKCRRVGGDLFVNHGEGVLQLQQFPLDNFAMVQKDGQTIGDGNVAKPYEFGKRLHFSDGHRCDAKATQDPNPRDIIGGVAPLTTLVPMNGIEEPLLFLITQCVDGNVARFRHF